MHVNWVETKAAVVGLRATRLPETKGPSWILARPVIDDVEYAEPSAIGELVVDEIQ